jgi:hypothetical protein
VEAFQRKIDAIKPKPSIDLPEKVPPFATARLTFTGEGDPIRACPDLLLPA